MATFRKINANDYIDDSMKNRGIQRGTMASSENSIKVDKLIGRVAHDLFNKHRLRYDLGWIRGLDNSKIPFFNGACVPDGGIFTYKNQYIFSIEAKYQNSNVGNAVERWFKNHSILRMLNPNITYLTFATGDGIIKAMPHVLDHIHLGENNIDHLFYNTIYYSKDGFSYYEVLDIAERLLVGTLKGLNDDKTSIYVGRWQDKINQALSSVYAK